MRGAARRGAARCGACAETRQCTQCDDEPDSNVMPLMTPGRSNRAWKRRGNSWVSVAAAWTWGGAAYEKKMA